MKLDEAKYILNKKGFLVEQSDDKIKFTDDEVYELIDKIKEIGINIEKRSSGYSFRSSNTDIEFGEAFKDKKNSWQFFIFDMNFDITTLLLMRKDDYGPVIINGLDGDEIIKYFEKYNYIDSYAYDMKNKISNYLVNKFNLETTESDPTPEYNYK